MSKKHSGVQREFSRLVKDDPRVDTSLRKFLSRPYQLKAIADYETGPGSHVSEESTREAIQTARQLVDSAQPKEATRRRAQGATRQELAHSYTVGISTIRRLTRAV